MTPEAWYAFAAAFWIVADAAAALHILLSMRDDTERAALWLVVIAFLPVAGLFLYLFCGVSRRNTLGRRVAERLDALRNAKDRDLVRLLGTIADSLAPFVFLNRAEGVPSASFRVMTDRLFPSEPPLSGNGIKLYVDGDEAYPAMLKAIRSARSTVNMQSFIFSNDRIGQAIMAELKEKARQGVQVKVIYDTFGSFGAVLSRFFLKYQRKTPNLRMHAFSHMTLFTPWRFQLRNHRKLLIVDGETAFIGGLNISADNFSWRREARRPEIHDLHCRVRGPAVLRLQQTFLSDWCVAAREDESEVFSDKYFPRPEKHGTNVVRTIASGHGYCFEGSENVFLTAAATAKRLLWICTPYFVPDLPLLRSLTLTAARGVDVRVIVPKKNNHRFMGLASKNMYETLLAHGVRIFERTGNFSHAKAMLCDNEWCLFGSSNCDVRSFRLNYELDLLISDGPFVRDLFTQLCEEFEQADEVSLQDAAKTSFPQRLAQAFCALFRPIL